ncbi:Gfo/Idh/MocA family protein [Candidatus Latescibacterota bacterium]
MGAVRLGIIGFGGMGSSHAGYLTKGGVNGAELVAVADVDPERLKWAEQTYPQVKRFDTGDALIESGEVDAIIIAAPHYFHPPFAIKGFEHGLHVMSEKPAGVYTRQVREMNEAASKSDTVFGVMFNQRARKQHQKLKELMASGEVGEIKRTIYIVTTWFRAQSYYDSGGWRATWAGEGGGVLANQCPHNLDLWQWIVGMPKRARAFCHWGKWHDIEVEDDVTAYFEYENGATGVFVTSTGESPGTNRMEISGDRGKVILEGSNITFWRTREPVSQFLKEYPGGFGQPENWKCEIPVPSGGGEHREVTQNWVDAIAKGTPLIAPGTDGINGVQLSNAMMLSTWTDDWVDIPVDEDQFYEELQKRVKTSKIKDAGGKALDVSGTF